MDILSIIRILAIGVIFAVAVYMASYYGKGCNKKSNNRQNRKNFNDLDLNS